LSFLRRKESLFYLAIREVIIYDDGSILYHRVLMTKNKIISILRQPQIKQQLMDAGMTHLRLFGSYARDEATDDSDIDLLYTYDTSKHKV